jgi:hypothetical protein
MGDSREGRSSRWAIVWAAAISLVGACNTPSTAPVPPPMAPPPMGPPQAPELPPGMTTQPQQKANYSGVYTADAAIDLTRQGVLGDFSAVLDGLSMLHNDPGRAIFEIAKADGNTKAVPSFLDSLFEALLTQEIRRVYLTNGAADDLSYALMGLGELARSVSLQNRVTIHKPDASMNVQVEEQITALALHALGGALTLPVPAAAQAQAIARMPGMIVAHANAPVADADIKFSTGSLKLPIGSLIAEAFNRLILQPYWGVSDLKLLFARIIPCDAVGVNVAIGLNMPEIGAEVVADLCRAGLIALGAKLTDKIANLSLDAQVNNASATLYDVSQSRPHVDYQSDSWAGGIWTWHIGTADLPLTFSGDRIADAQ